MNNTLTIAYTLTNESLYYTIVSIVSLFEKNKNNNINLNIVFDESLEKDNLKLFDKFKNNKNCLNLNYIKIDSSKYDYFKRNIFFSERFYILELPNLIDSQKILYLNSYSIINSDLSELYNIDLTNNSCAAAEYIYAQDIKDKINKDNIFAHNNILINTQKWLKNEYYQKFISKDFLKNLKITNNSNYNDDSIKLKTMNDTDCLNYIIDDCKLIDLKYNYTEDWYSKNKKQTCSIKAQKEYKNLFLHIENPEIITLIGPKPLDENCHNSYLNLWWKYAEFSPVYKEIKEFRQLNKYKLSATSAQNSFKYTWLLSRIFPYIKPYWFRILLSFAIAIPLGLLDGVTALALKPYMDYVVGSKAFEFSFQGLEISISSAQMAFILPVGVILFAAIQGVLRYLNGYFSFWVSARITNDVKFDLFKRLIYMHPQFFDDNSSGIVISRYMGDPGAASAGIVDNIKTITTSLCGALGLIAVMIYSSWKLAFIGVIILCVAFVPVILIRNRIKEASNKSMVIGGNITTNINETYSGNKVMTAYGLQERQNEYFKEQVWKAYNIGMSLYKRSGWMSPLMYLIASFGIALVLGYGTYLINSNQMTAGAFASFTTSLLLLYKPVKTLGNTLTGIQNIFVAMGRVFELFDLDSAIQDTKTPRTLKGFEKSIDFSNVNFEYIPNNPVLKNLNLHIDKNETIAIVGNSGGGKSTLVNLLPRFYDIKSGSIKIDNIDIKEFSLNSLRENIAIVFQDNFLFTGTIKENILMGKEDATSEELIAAIKSAHLEEMIQELPDGLDTMLGERGLTLSGGQRQRIAIARAMLKNAPIIILDEATSALDNESEAIVQKAMDNLTQNKTVLIIAHRLSTIKNASRIAVITEGELTELGTHEELIKLENGQYKALYEMQFRNKEGATIKN